MRAAATAVCVCAVSCPGRGVSCPALPGAGSVVPCCRRGVRKHGCGRSRGGPLSRRCSPDAGRCCGPGCPLPAEAASRRLRSAAGSVVAARPGWAGRLELRARPGRVRFGASLWWSVLAAVGGGAALQGARSGSAGRGLAGGWAPLTGSVGRAAGPHRPPCCCHPIQSRERGRAKL